MHLTVKQQIQGHRNSYNYFKLFYFKSVRIVKNPVHNKQLINNKFVRNALLLLSVYSSVTKINAY